MYLEYFQLKTKPFQISPDPRFLWLGETHKEALSILKYGIMDNRGLLLLVGDIGTGKTTLINGLLDSLDPDTIVATIRDPGLEKLEFYNFIAAAFKMGKRFGNKGDFLVNFIHFLHKAHAHQKKVLLIIDEAQRLDHEMLEEIRQLSNIERKDTKLLNIFLVGQNELNDKIVDQRNRALRQRITTRYSIGPLKPTEIKEYIQFRLSVAGTDRKIFTSAALRGIVAYSQCYPRLINIICDHALLTAFTRDKRRIDAKIIQECAAELQISPVHEPGMSSNLLNKLKSGPFNLFQGKPALALSVYGLGLILLLLAIGYLNFPGDTEQIPAAAPSKSKQKVAAPRATPPPAVPQSSVTAQQPRAGTNDRSRIKSAPSPLPVAPPSAKPASGEPSSSAAPADQPSAPLFPPDHTFVINFPLDSNDFTDQGYLLLGQLVRHIAAVPDTHITITGYTDSVGDETYNQRLSEFRANMVKSYLVGQGVNPARIQTSGRGPANPIQSNATNEGRRANRRVEIKLN
jgi:general secretion pathway protein A